MPPPTAVDNAVKDIRHHMESGVFNPITHDDMRSVANTLKNLDGADARAVIQKLSPDELRDIAGEIQDDGWFGTGGLDQGEKTDLFNEMARDLGGAELAKFAGAFDRTQGRQTARDRLASDDNIAQIARAVSQHGDVPTQLAFIRELAGQSTDQTKVETMNETRMYDPQARAIAEVIGGMGNVPGAAEVALESLAPDQRRAVINASTSEKLLVSGAMGGVGAVRTDTSLFDKLMDVSSRIGDADTKARVFADAASELKDLASRGRGDAADEVRKSMGKLLQSDVNGIVGELAANTETSNGTALATYMKAALEAKDFGTLGELQAQMSLGNGKNEDPVARFEQTVTSPSGAPRHANAEAAGYFAGALSAAVTSITKDAKEQGDLINATLKSVLTVVDKTAGRAHPGVGIAASVLKEWTQFGVKAAMDAKISDQVSADDKIFWALVPSRETRVLPNGQPDREAAAGSASASAFNSAWIVTREHAKP